jgi:hypothetical protein
VSNEGTILHADADSFYASVEQRDDPNLRGRPVIVGGGVVLAASYEAKAYGVRTPMGQVQALRLCPDAIVVSPRMETYSTASKAMFEVFNDTTPFVEGLSIDEAFLEVGGLRRISGTPTEIAVRLRREVLEKVGLPITVGVARTKFLAKVASGVAKPDGLLVVPIEGELAFLHPLPVERLWGVGPVTADKLRERSITTVAEVARLGEASLGGSSAAPRAVTSTRSLTTRILGGSTSAAGAARSGPSGRSVEDRGHRSRSTPTSSRWWIAWRAGCERPTGSAARSCSACGSTTSPERRGRTRSPRQLPIPRRCSWPSEPCSRRPCR